MSRSLSSRQEAFCRHFCASGNAADAARRAGYAAGSARQTGHALLNHAWVIDRIRAIREHWRQTAQDEAAILLARLEQAWDAAVAAQSATQMLQVIRLQADIAGLSRKGQSARADLWSAPDEGGDMGSPRPAALLRQAVRRGRDRAEREFADWRRTLISQDQALDAGRTDAAAKEARRRLDVHRNLRRAIDDRRVLSQRGRPEASVAAGTFTGTNPDISLHRHVDQTTPVQDAEIDAAEAGNMTCSGDEPAAVRSKPLGVGPSGQT